MFSRTLAHYLGTAVLPETINGHWVGDGSDEAARGDYWIRGDQFLSQCIIICCVLSIANHLRASSDGPVVKRLALRSPKG